MLESARARAGAAPLPRLRWALLSNTTQDPLRPFLAQTSRAIGFDADVWIGGYDTALQDATAPECANADVAVIALRLQVLAPALVDRFVALTGDEMSAGRRRVLDYSRGVIDAVRQQSRALILVHSFETPLYPELGVIDYRNPSGQVNTIRRLNLDLAEHVARTESAFVVDLDAIRARLADAPFVDAR